jgi:Ca2+/Na+ antiporter
MTTNQQVPRAGIGTRIAARGAAAIVAIVAGAASFEHIASVAIGAGERAWVAYSLPFAIDGLIVVGVAALLEDQRQGRHRRLSARLAVLVGVIATLAANVASAEPTWTARLVALAAPVSFLLSVEVLTRTGRKLSTPDDNTTTGGAGRASGDPPAGATTTGPRQRQRAAPRSRPTAAQRVTQAAAKTPTATSAEIAARLKVSERTVQRYRPGPPATPPVAGNGATAGTSRPGVAPVPAAAFARTTGPASTDRAGAGT